MRKEVLYFILIVISLTAFNSYMRIRHENVVTSSDFTMNEVYLIVSKQKNETKAIDKELFEFLADLSPENMRVISIEEGNMTIVFHDGNKRVFLNGDDGVTTPYKSYSYVHMLRAFIGVYKVDAVMKELDEGKIVNVFVLR